VFSGVVFFTTFKPSSDICAVGGSTFIWAINYKTGGASAALLGKALLQVSTGEIKELSLESVFTEKGGRRSAAITGVPPKGQGLSVLIAPKPLRKILHMQEK
jgi:type IV pilus assembly protein PilY1